MAFVDDGTAARALLRRNIELMRAMGTTDVWRRDATNMGPNRGPGHGRFLLDPPYGKGLGERALAFLRRGRLGLRPAALIVWEESATPVIPDGFEELDQRRYGDTLITILRAPDGIHHPPRSRAVDCDGVVVDSEPATFDLLAEDFATRGLTS